MAACVAGQWPSQLFDCKRCLGYAWLVAMLGTATAVLLPHYAPDEDRNLLKQIKICVATKEGGMEQAQKTKLADR